MQTKTINAELLRRMLCSAAIALQEKQNEINRLNVFPVPDGDTGSNMYLTMEAVRSMPQTIDSADAYSEAAAKAVMRSARGNSGVILSLFFRGMAAAFAGHETVDVRLLIEAFRTGSDSARKAVMNPVEGTILTVMRECTEFKKDIAGCGIDELLKSILELAQESLKRTPELLPALKKAKVVDSGGYGFCIALSGMIRALGDDYVEEYSAPVEVNSNADFSSFSEDEITFSFCTECLINRGEGIEDSRIEELRPFLSGIGDSIVLAADDEIVKVHVHTNEPMDVIGRMTEFGTPQFIKVENMRQQHSALVTEDEQEKLKDEYGIIAVANGSGFHDLFMELGAGYVIAGGQSMNPSAGEFIKAIKELGCRKVIILPNNSNIVLTARQAASLVEGVQAEVLDTVTIPQGISALISFDSACSMEENLENMKFAKEGVKTLSITRAARNADVDGIKVKRKQYLGIADKKIACATDSVESCIVMLAKEIEDREIITMYCGKGVKRSEAEKSAELLKSALKPHQQISVVSAKQPVYRYIISAE